MLYSALCLLVLIGSPSRMQFEGSAQPELDSTIEPGKGDDEKRMLYLPLYRGPVHRQRKSIRALTPRHSARGNWICCRVESASGKWKRSQPV
ncbi:hypothetical protein K227x_31250 [Rubripirellula lacrimiformis]|uniref:Uncharacterized protein n=1 Tax=Rubripirellula lacrimiformis TaxID=1930273 RepID=A0A517NC75_9BACT|nr:hypothetical protein K227x_31250 [Rubripirellula lacrimiformis]